MITGWLRSRDLPAPTTGGELRPLPLVRGSKVVLARSAGNRSAHSRFSPQVVISPAEDASDRAVVSMDVEALGFASNLLPPSC